MSKGKFKRSKKLEVNRRNSARFVKMIGKDEKGELFYPLEIFPVKNEDRMQSVGKLEDSKEVGKLRPVKLKSRVKLQVVQKAILKQFYGRHLNQTKLHEEVHSSYRKTPLLSVVSGREQIVAIVRQRSGRSETREIAEAIIRDGHVQLLSKGKILPVKYRSRKLGVGDSLVVKENYYKKIREGLSYYKDEKKRQNIPVYLDVDQKLGSVTLLHEPRDGEVLYPEDRKVSMSNRKKY